MHGKLEGSYDLILYGLGVMGENFIRNFARKGYRVIGVNRTVATTREFAAKVKDEDVADRVGTADTLEDAVPYLKESGGAVIAMIKANDPTTETWGPIDELFFTGSQAKFEDRREDIPALCDLVPEGTVIVDAANSHPRDTARRAREMEERGHLFLGAGVSGGAEGALHGPSIMPGGSKRAYSLVGEMLESAAADADGPCCAYTGGGGAGHLVKIVHNGIEYGIMQALAEVYYSLRYALGREPSELHPLFQEMASGREGGYLTEITAELLGMQDRDTGKPMLDVIQDTASQKGTGKWTSQFAFDLGVPVPTITAALEARNISALKGERTEASRSLNRETLAVDIDEEQFVAAARDALYGSMIAAYAQGLALLQTAAEEPEGEHDGACALELDLGGVADLWKGGCIIRSKLLYPIQEAFEQNPDLPNLLVAPRFREILNDRDFQRNWRSFVSSLGKLGLPRNALSSSLNYVDDYSTERLAANMIQGQRDRFGHHGFRRTDRDGDDFHLTGLE